MKKILGLDLGVTSIGWAYVHEAENDTEHSSIDAIGVRVNPLGTDEKADFEKGKPITTNAARTLKRSMRRNLDRYQLRRARLIKILKDHGIIDDQTILSEDGSNTTFETWRLRSDAVTKKLEKHELARVLLTINKKRGYKSGRKIKEDTDGNAIDGMPLAKQLMEENITPGEYVFNNLNKGKQLIPSFYPSDLVNEFNRIWQAQSNFYPDILTEELKDQVLKAKTNINPIFFKLLKINEAEVKKLDEHLINQHNIKLTARYQKKLQTYYWRKFGLSNKLEIDQLINVLKDIIDNQSKASGLLGKISDRSKHLYFKHQTIGQHLFELLKENRHTSLKNHTFYRQDYYDEFEAIWKEQSKHYPELTPTLKEEIGDKTIFYQRKLKSQKALVSLCEFENKTIIVNGKEKLIGLRVAPKASPLFQEFKIWQILHNLELKRKNSQTPSKKQPKNQLSLFSPEIDKNRIQLGLDTKNLLFDELNVKGKLNVKQLLSNIELDHETFNLKDWDINYTAIEGNETNRKLYNAYLKIANYEGYDVSKILNTKTESEDFDVNTAKASGLKIKAAIADIFDAIGIDTEILNFRTDLDQKEFEKQTAYQFWHLLYSFEGDSPFPKPSQADIDLYGSKDISLKKKLCNKFGFKPEHAKILAEIDFGSDYCSLSTKAMRKILLHMKDGIPFASRNHELSSQSACDLAGYNHSKQSLTKEENDKRILKPTLELLKKNSLRNPVVEKILNQMINLINALIEKNSKRDENGEITEYFKFDEIRIELARELKKNQQERKSLEAEITRATKAHEEIKSKIRDEFNIANPTRNDIIKYKLYLELKNNGYKDLYTNTYIPKEILFSGDIDVDHIIPQARQFDDSFSNKTLTYRETNLKKGNRTAYDYILAEHGEQKLSEFIIRLEGMHKKYNPNTPEEGISKSKYQKLLKKESEIGDGFIERDLRETQYIAKKAKEILLQISRTVVSTSGSVTDKLREDWGLINVMQELNFEKYKKAGLTELITRKDGTKVERIKDWSKRNDHRHHAMDALTVAFTKHSHIQYLNHLNARFNEKNKLHGHIIAIEKKELTTIINSEGQKVRVFKEPIPNFRSEAKKHLEAVLVSHKAKNKVVTRNRNRIKVKNGEKVKVELTPRGQLHNETIYGSSLYYQVEFKKVDGSFDLQQIEKVAKKKFREALRNRLLMFDNDPKAAFTGKNSLSKKPIFLDPDQKYQIPEKVKLVTLERRFTQRVELNSANFDSDKGAAKILDPKIREQILPRFPKSDDKKTVKVKNALADLEVNPIIVGNSETGSRVKRVTIDSVKSAEPLRIKRNHLGLILSNSDSERIENDFVQTSGNHHLAIYKDSEGNLQDNVVTLKEVVLRVNQGLSIIDKNFNQELGWSFLYSIKRNECFIDMTNLGNPNMDLLNPENKKYISPNLFINQSLSKKLYGNNVIRDFQFKSHLDSSMSSKRSEKLRGIDFFSIKSLEPLNNLVKIRLNHLGDIVAIGEE